MVIQRDECESGNEHCSMKDRAEVERRSSLMDSMLTIERRLSHRRKGKAMRISESSSEGIVCVAWAQPTDASSLARPFECAFVWIQLDDKLLDFLGRDFEHGNAFLKVFWYDNVVRNGTRHA